MNRKSFTVTFYVKATDMTPATPMNTKTMAIPASSWWMARQAAREALCAEYPSGLGGSKAVILDVAQVAR